jgi:hypothetical protein
VGEAAALLAFRGGFDVVDLQAGAAKITSAKANDNRNRQISGITLLFTGRRRRSGAIAG